MLSKNEKKIVSFINYLPFIVILFLVILLSVIYVHNNALYKKDVRALKDTFISKNKTMIQLEVNRVYKYIQHEKSNSEKGLKESIASRVNEVHAIMTAIYTKYKNKESKQEITNRIKDVLKNYRYKNKRGYFYINDLNGMNILHPLNPSIEGTNIKKFKDKRGNSPVVTSINSLKKKDSSFNTVYWGKPNDPDNEYKKISYNKVFKPYNWFVGTGEYVIDFEKKIKEKILSYITSLRYLKNGYVFIVDYEGTYLSHIKKAYIGKNRIDLRDRDGFEITKQIIKIAQIGDGYLQYIGTIKPETNLPSSKTSYVKGFESWKWAIASGFYNDELENELKEKELELYNDNKKELINLLGISIVFVLISSFLSFYISKLLKKQFSKYKNEVLRHIDSNREKDTVLAQQSKMAAMGEMLQNIAHQWRQPLSLISTVSSGVKFNKEHGILSDESLFESMDKINESTNYLSHTIEDFMDFFNPNKKCIYFNLNTMVDKVIKLLELQFAQNNIEILSNVKDIEVYGYENELIQVLINICNNSRDELLKSHPKEQIIVIETVIKDNKIILTIKDNAGGIDEKIIDRIFEPYFTTKHQSQGTGIGLYMSQEIIVKHMKGTLSVNNIDFIHHNTLYKGALFTITLDLKSDFELI